MAYVHLFNTGLSYAPISVSFFVNFACLISNFVSVIDVSLGFNFHILEGYIIEFVVDTIRSYSDVEREFFKGPRGRFLLSLQLCIKMLIYEKVILKMNSKE